MVSSLQQDNILPKNFQITYDPEIDVFLPQAGSVRRDWPFQGFPLLLVLQKWMFIIGSNQNLQKKDKEKVGWTVQPTTVEKKIGIHFALANHISEGNDSGLEIHVNPPNNGPLGPGRHTAISFRPDFRGVAYWSMSPQLSVSPSLTRSIIHSGQQGGSDTNLRKGEGMSSHQSSPSVDDPVLPKQAANAVESQIAGAASNDGSLFTPAVAEVELLGIPQIDEIDYIGKNANLFVWNPAYLNIAGRANPITGIEKGISGGWDRRPPRDTRWPTIFIITGISHYISTEGVYSTSLKLAPTGENLPYGQK